MSFFFLKDYLAADAFLDEFEDLPEGSFFEPQSPCSTIISSSVSVEPAGREIKHHPLKVTLWSDSAGSEEFSIAQPAVDGQPGVHWTAASHVSVDIRLLPIPTLAIARIPYLPVSAALWRDIEDDVHAYLLKHVSQKPYTGFSVWASRDRYDPQVCLSPDMGVVQLSLTTDTAARWPSLYKTLVLEVLDLIVERFPNRMAAHLVYALKFEAYRQFLSDLNDYKVARDLIRRFEDRLRGTYQRHRRTLADGSPDNAKAIAQLVSVLKAEVAIPDADRDMLKRRATDIAVLLAATPLVSATQSDATGLAFEQEVESSLRALGFSTEGTSATGDFGIDVIAEKAGLRYAIQCKDPATPVGVKAVQEAAAGRRVYKSDYACAVSRTGFTRAAHELAFENSVLLVSFEQIDRIEQLPRLSE